MARAVGVLPRPHLDLRGLLTRNVPLKIAAVAVALLVWLALSQAQAPEEQTVGFDSIPVQRHGMPAGYVLRGSLGAVNVNVHGPVNDLHGLAVEFWTDGAYTTTDVDLYLPHVDETVAVCLAVTADSAKAPARAVGLGSASTAWALLL